MKQLIKLDRMELINGSVLYVMNPAALERERKAIRSLSSAEMRQQLWNELRRLNPEALKGDLLECLYKKFPAFLHRIRLHLPLHPHDR